MTNYLTYSNLAFNIFLIFVLVLFINYSHFNLIIKLTIKKIKGINFSFLMKYPMSSWF